MNGKDMEPDNPLSVKELQELVEGSAESQQSLLPLQRQLDTDSKADAKEDFEAQRRSEEAQRLHAENENYKQDIALRRRWANSLLVLLWSVFVFIVAITSLAAFWPSRVHDNLDLFKVLVSGACLDLIGLGYIVAHYLFPDAGRKQQPDKNGKIKTKV
jgi:hypothetical protein